MKDRRYVKSMRYRYSVKSIKTYKELANRQWSPISKVVLVDRPSQSQSFIPIAAAMPIPYNLDPQNIDLFLEL